MALKAHAPIVPVYISPYTKWYHRTVIVIGEKIESEEYCNGTPSLDTLDKTSKKLREKETALMEIYNKWKTKKSSK